MKGLFLTILLMMTNVCFAQQHQVFERGKKIQLLVSSREEVVRLFDEENKFPYPATGEFFSFENEGIYVTYATGKCSDEYQDWNVREGVATEIRITPKYALKKDDLGINFSKFRKQRTDPQRKGIYVLYDKRAGLAISVHYDQVKTIYLFPAAGEYKNLCENPEVREYYEAKRWTRKPVPKNLIIDYNKPANVVNVQLTAHAADPRKFNVLVNALDPENDVLTYDYRITGGRILGVGASVVWDLTAVAPGTYKLVTGVDDGCGICGQYVVKTVVIK